MPGIKESALSPMKVRFKRKSNFCFPKILKIAESGPLTVYMALSAIKDAMIPEVSHSIPKTHEKVHLLVSATKIMGGTEISSIRL
jgi:hypothetical protein